jgi:hypothetical protein
MFARGASILTIVASLLVAAPAGAAECVGIKFPDQLALDGKTLALNGLGLREATMLKVDVYVAALYLEQTSPDPGIILGAEQTLRFVMRFVRDVERDDIVEAFEDGYEDAAENLDALRDRIATLNGWMPAISDGDRMAFTYRPGKGLEVQVGDTVKGTIPGADFARATLAIWLGDEPPNPGIKTGLLGGACG